MTTTTSYKTPGNVDVPDATQLVPNYNYRLRSSKLLDGP